MVTLDQDIKIIGRLKLRGKSPIWGTSVVSILSLAVRSTMSSSTRTRVHCSWIQLHPEQERSVHVCTGRSWRYLFYIFCSHILNWCQSGKKNTIWYLCSHSVLCVIKDTNIVHSFLKSSDNYIWYDYIISGPVHFFNTLDRTPCFKNWSCFCFLGWKGREASIHLYLINYLLTPWSRVLLEKLTSF